MDTDQSETLEVLVSRKLDEARKRNDFDELIRLARVAKAYQALEEEQRMLAERRTILAAQLRAEKVQPEPVSSAVISSGRKQELSPRSRGEKVRADWVRQKAPSLVRREGKKYETMSGRVVGVAYARELDVKPDAWFLGYEDEMPDYLVLLCEEAVGQLLDFVLPPDIVGCVWKQLSRSGGQVKFNVIRSGCNFYLRVPGSQHLPINQHLGKVETLR